MKIGDLSRATGCTVETIRYYERVGLLPPPARSAGNYRHYAEAALDRLAFIRRCRSLDMSLDEIVTLVRAAERPGDDCGGVDALLETHLDHVAVRIRDLRTLQRQLQTLRAACTGDGSVANCGILKGLTQAATASPDCSHPAGHIAGSHLRSAARPTSASAAATTDANGARPRRRP
jgi:Cd(II)/Pb(II)-responsive transcriptional regulator